MADDCWGAELHGGLRIFATPPIICTEFHEHVFLFDDIVFECWNVICIFKNPEVNSNNIIQIAV